MNAGLSSLNKLKLAVLPPAQREDPSYDDVLQILGLGIAAGMEHYLDRKLQWMEGETEDTDAQRIFVGVPRYPVAVWSAVAMQSTPSAEWQDITSQVTRYLPQSGLVMFRTSPGDESATIRVTYSGGFWWDEDEEGSGVMPDGATALPPSLFTAWTMQVQAAINALDLLKAQANQDVFGAASNLLTNAQQFIPAVEGLLKPYRRMVA